MLVINNSNFLKLSNLLGFCLIRILRRISFLMNFCKFVFNLFYVDDIFVYVYLYLFFSGNVYLIF